MTIHSTEAEERAYVKEVAAKLHHALRTIENQIDATRVEVIEAKTYVWTNRAGLDPAERAANRIDISLAIDQGERAVERHRRLQKLIRSPYFGRVDFMSTGGAEADAYYIGVHSFGEEDSRRNVIYDWRSPVASLFYDYHEGRAAYDAPEGVVEGEIRLKRQYKIIDGELEYMIESAMHINDEVLQKELSRASDEKMRNIVATIQKEQSMIIRNEHSRELIIQGVAGSGKTSVALHRVAFLLYRYKGTISSQNILIISPNKVFSDYISSVLPELGEEKILETGFDELAAGELDGICRFQTFAEQVSQLTASADEALMGRIRIKAGLSFIHSIEQFARHCAEAYFVPADVSFPSVTIAKEEIASAYLAAGSLPVKPRLEKTASIVAGAARDENGNKLKPAAAGKVKKAIKKMFKTLDLLSLYKDLYAYIGQPELFKLLGPKTLEYGDVFPAIYLKMLLEGVQGFDSIKHVVVDEMQDYTAVQYAVIARLFPCKKTILGDANQSVNPYSSSSLAEIRQVFPEADTVELVKSYRSTFEIIEFARQIHPNSRMIPVERHGDSPRIIASGDERGQLAAIGTAIGQFLQSEHRSLLLVCKTQDQAERLFRELKDQHDGLCLLDFNSEKFREGILIASAHMAKGLEFDQVVVPFCDAGNYATELDRSLLYIACTRALHKLTLTYEGEASPLLPAT